MTTLHATIRSIGRVLGHASRQVLGTNIEAYENTIPSLLSDRLANPKFAGPEHPQTGIAAGWEPDGNSMAGLACRLVPGMYLSGRESQLIHNYSEHGMAGILQAGVAVRSGETFEIEMWARAHDRPVVVSVELRQQGRASPPASNAQMTVDLAHWHRRTCRISSPDDGNATFAVRVSGDSRLAIDQIHLRPAGDPHVSPAFLKAFDELPCPVIRFPGGCASCTYHWEHGTGPVHLRPVCDDPVFKHKVHYDFGTDEYLDLCVARNIRPFITLNTTTATPDDAAAWAGYVRRWYSVRRLPVPAAYFMFGNENYGTWELGHMTGEMYVAGLREFVPPVRDAYPEARIVAIAEYESGGLRDAYRTPWRSVVIEQAADLIDVLAVTRYSRGSDSFSREEAMSTVADSVSGKAADLDRQADSIRASGHDLAMAIVEWNYWTRASHNDHAGFYEPNDIRHCLYAAGLINAFCRMGEILETANHYSLVNTMGMIHVRDGRLELTDLVKVFNLYSPALPGQVLDIDLESPALTSSSRVVDAACISAADGVYSFLLNYSTDTVEVAMEGFGAISGAVGVCADAILKPVRTIEPAVEKTTVILPPMSLVRVRCDGGLA